ncbi:MAG: thioredoxin-disulfide reductase [Elusimicrobiota bacterium]|nr:thioredoxin-disulfide reductase [Elusimicrobiota bacterium]
MTEQNTHFDIITIGSGPAGFTAAIYAARGGASAALFGGVAPGGQLLQTMEIENYPGFAGPVVGADLMQSMLNQASRMGAIIFRENITAVDLSRGPFALIAGSGKSYTAGSVIIATGAQARWLGLPSEQKYIGKGVSGCATCDGFFFRGREVCVIGGGDSAAEDALFLTKFASKVYLVHRRDALRATFRLQEKLRAAPKIEIVYDHVPEEFTGEARLTGVNFRNVRTGAVRRLETTGAFIAIGHTPATKIFDGKVNLDGSGYIVTDARMGTSVPGVFAAGDVMDTRYKQAVVAAGSGCRAAMEALLYLEEVKK